MKTIQFFALFATLACATSSLSATTLQSLVTNKHKDGDVIVVPNGTYEPSNLINETRHLTFRAETDGGVIIDGGNTARCVDLSDAITLEGFVLQNGKADQGGGVRGGTIIRTTVQHCSATFGGGSYKTHARASIYKGNSAAFFGMAAYGGSVFSCRVEGNTSSAYGGGMGALFGVTVANTSVTSNTALRDNAGVLASPAQNMVYFGNVAERGLYEGAPMNSANALGSEVENAVSVAEEDIFNDAAAGDYSLNVNKATNLIKDKGDTALGGNYDTLWYDTDLAGRPRMLGQSIDLGPYEIADTFTVTCKVVGVGSVTISPNFIQEGDPVTLTATADATYPRDFIGFYVNGELIATETTCTYKPVKSDAIEARFAGLSATTSTLTDVLTQLHPTIREEVTLANGNYTISSLAKAVAFVGSSIENTTITLSDDCKDSVFVNTTVTGTASNATLHRCLVSNFSGSNLTLTSSVLASNCGAMSGSAVNVTAYTTMPAGLTTTDCVILNATTNTVAGAILPKQDANIDAGQGSVLVPYDNLDIGGRPRVIGTKIDRGAHECHYVTVTVEAEGYYTDLTPAVGTDDVLTGDVITLSGTSPREFMGWTLADGTLVSAVLNATMVVPEMNTTLKATFAGFTMNPGDAVPEGTQAADTITLAAGTYTQDFNTPAKIVGTGKQGDVILTGTLQNATLDAVTLTNATLTDVTLNRCYVNGGTITNGKVYNSILVNVSFATGEYVNNTTVNTTLPAAAINTRALNATVDDYTPTQAEADNGESMTADQREALGDYDYYGNPRVNNSTIDKGAVEYVWEPYTVTINVVGHGLVSPRGAVKVVRGEALYFTVSEDPKHPRGAATVVNAQWVSEGLYRVDPTADMTVTVTFPGLTVGADGQYADITAAIAEAQDGETITVAPGTYGAVDVKGKRLKLVAASSNPYDTIIDAQGLTRAVKLADGAEIIGFTIQNGLSNEGAGVYGGTVRRSVIRWNTLTYNGFGAGVSKVFAESCLIVDNGSTAVERSNGGGAANADLLNCTVVRNVADKGAGLYDCTAKNAVIALNVDLTGASSDWTGDSVEPDPSDCCTPTSGGIAVDATKLFVDAANDDWRLQEGVACVNAGAADERLGALDVTGAPRIYGEAVDMGALEWDAPDRKVKISLQGRGIATVSYTKENVTTAATVKWGTTETLSVPHGTDTLTLTWCEDSTTTVSRSLAGVMADGVLIAGSTAAANGAFGWTLATRDTVNVDLVFVAEDLQVNTNDTLTNALDSAIAGETIRVASGEYTTAITVGEGITVDGGKEATLAGGVTLADGAVLKNLTVTTTGVVGPETGSATLQHCVVTEVNGTAVERNVIVKTCLIHNNTGSGLKDATAYLSTIAANQGEGVTGASKLYGSIVWGNSTDVTSSVEVVDSYVGGNPRFILPAPDGENYALMSSSPAIDVAKMAQWEGFTDADRALTDLAGNPRPRLTGFDAGAYELQTDATMDTLWTWYGTDYTMDGTVSGAYWRQMAYGAPRSVPAGEDARITDRAGYTSATLKVDGDSSFGNVAFLNANADLRIEDAGGTWTIASLANKSTASALTIDAKINVGSAFYQNGGSLTLEPNADFTLGGHFSAVNIPVKQTGGAFTVASGNTDMMGSSTYLLSDGRFNFGTYLNLRDSSVMTVSGGELSGEEISIAQTSGKTPLLITGGSVNVTRIETGDTNGGRWGDIVQTGGTVTITGSGSGKQAPLHISHWSGNSTYTLRGGELNVLNGEVRLGQDGNGTLRLEGGVAKLNTVSISNGKFQLAGGTVEAATPAGAFTAEAVEGTISTIVAYPKDNTGLTLNLTGSGTVNLAQGKYTSAATITGQHIMMVAGTKLHASVDHSNGNVLTLEGNPSNYIEIYGTYKPGQLAFSSLPPLNEDKYVLFIHQTGSDRFETVEIAEPWKSCCTVTVENYAMYTAIKVNRYAEPTTVGGVTGSTTPTITVDGNTTWSDATKWSVPFVQDGAAIVNAVSSGTLHIDPSTRVKVNTLTFNVPEGVTLNVTATTIPNATTVKKTGLGTLKWSTMLSYTNFNEGEGTFIAAASNQSFNGKAFETMAFRAEANSTLSGQSRVHATVVDDVVLTLNTATVLDGSITYERKNKNAYGSIESSKAITFIGNFIAPSTVSAALSQQNNGKITLAGTTTLDCANFIANTNVAYAGHLLLKTTSNQNKGALTAGLKTFDLTTNNVTLGTTIQALNNQWPDGAMKIGSGTLTFPKGYGLAGTATFSGPVTFNESLTTTGALHFKSDAVVTIPYGCTLTAADEIRVEPGARFIITPPQDYVTEGATVPLLVSTKTAGLRVDQLATVAVAWATAPSDSAISNPIASLNGDTLQYIVTLSTVKTWTGAASSDWSTSGNWSGTGDVAYFTRSPSQKTVTLSQSVAPSRMTIKSGAYTFTGNYAFEGKPDVTQYADSGEEPGATWRTFFSRGSYMLHAGATAKLALNDWTYNGSFMGSGNVVVAEGRFALGAASNAFVGNMIVESGATLRLCNEDALYNATVTLKGTLAIEKPASLANLTADSGTLTLFADKPLTIRQSLTGTNLMVEVVNLEEAGDWTILNYPATTSTTFELADTIAPELGLVASLKRSETALILVVRAADNIEWTGTKIVDGITTDTWKVNDADVEVTDVTDKHLFFNDVETVDAASVALPNAPRSLTVTAQTTHYTLSGVLPNVPMTVEQGAQFTLATSSATPTMVTNEGAMIVTGVLDLTNATLSGYGQYIVGDGGVIRIGAQTLAEAKATFVRNGGQIIVVTEGDFSLPDNRVPTENGAIVKEGAGTLYLPPATLTQPLNIREGTVAPMGGMALKARYLKFEPHERFTDSGEWLPSTGLSDFVTMLSGERQNWPEGTKVVRFDSGKTNRIQVGVANDAQSSVIAVTGNLNHLIDNNPKTELVWNEWNATYGVSGQWPRCYFVVDAGEEGVCFTGYNVGTPSGLGDFFWHWSVAMANDISEWHPTTDRARATDNEAQVWQQLDDRVLPESNAGMSTLSWLTPAGYTVRRASGLWSNFTAPITLDAGATFDLTKAIGTSGILQDQVEIASLTGEGAVMLPATLQVKAGTLTVKTLNLVGSSVLSKPITATTAASFESLVVSESVATAFNNSSSTQFVLVEGYTGAKPTLVGMTSPEDGGKWILRLDGTTLKLVLDEVTQRDLVATLTEETTAWDALTWYNTLGEPVTKVDWAKVQTATIQLTEASPDVAQVTIDKVVNLNTLMTFAFDFGVTQRKTIALAGEGRIVVPQLTLTANDTKTAYGRLALLSAGLIPTDMAAIQVMDSMILSIASADVFEGETQVNLTSPRFVGNGTLEIAADEGTVPMVNHSGEFTGDILVTSGTLKFPKGSGGSGPVYGRVITVSGANAALATGTNNDATGWNVSGRQRIVLTEQGEFKVYKRDTLKTPVTMAGGVIRLMETAGDSGRGLDWYNSVPLTVDALDGALTTSYITYAEEATGNAIKMNIREGSFPVEVKANARLVVDANLYGGAITKTGAGELVLTNAENSYGATTIDAGTLTVTGATGTGVTTMAVGTTLRGSGTVKGALTFTNTVEEVITGWPTFEVAETPLTVNGAITGVAQLRVNDDLLALNLIPVVTASNVSVNTFTNVPNGFELRVINGTLFLVKSAAAHTMLHATVTTSANWSALAWTDAKGVPVEEVVWDLVESVTLTAEADTTVTRDVTTLALTSLTVTASDYTLAMKGKSLNGVALALTGDLLIADANTLTALPTLSGTGTLKLAKGVTVTVALTSESDNRLHQKKIDVATGATLVIDGNGANRKQDAVDYSGITGSGKIEFKNSKGNQWMSHPTKQYADTLTLVHNVDMPLSHEFVTTPLTVRDLQGGGNFRFDYGSKNSGARVVKTIQTQNTTWSGTYSATHEGRSLKLLVVSDATIPSLDKMLTLSATNTNEQTLEVEACGAINVTGKWTGATTISGLLTGSGAIHGAVTFNEGAVVVADGQALTLGAVTSTATVIEVTANAAATLVDADAKVTVFTSTSALDVAQYTVDPDYALAVETTGNGSALVVKRVNFVTITGTEIYATETQETIRDLILETLPEGTTAGAYAVTMNLYTQNNETPIMPSAEMVDGLFACFENIAEVNLDMASQTATIVIAYEFGLEHMTVDADLTLYFKAVVEGGTDEVPADYAAGVSFSIYDLNTGLEWDIAPEMVEFPEDEVGVVYLTLPDATPDNHGKASSVLTSVIGARKFRVRVKR